MIAEIMLESVNLDGSIVIGLCLLGWPLVVKLIVIAFDNLVD